ncbi:MAG: hypothetical protein LBT09_10495 [Planctomycetaceae bacterium]|jgi:hypothetical protein|nr:hypothetical protein [Planctomycetaceae bacterium]
MAIDFEKKGGDESDTSDLDFLSNFSFDDVPSDNSTNGISTDNFNLDPDGNSDAGINSDAGVDFGTGLDVGAGINVGDSLNVDTGLNANGGLNVDVGFNTGAGDVGLDRPVVDRPNLKTRMPDLPPDFFTLVLGLALVAIIIASILLFLEVNSYGPDPLSGLPKL